MENFLITYPNINPEWLLTGRGEMLRKLDEKNQNISSKGHQIVNSHSSAIITADKNTNELKKENTALKKRIKELETDRETFTKFLTKFEK